MRKVTVFSMNNSQRVQVSTSASTWGEVKGQSSDIRSMVTSDMKIVIKNTKAVIETDDTVLPDGDVTIYLFPGKVKSGVSHWADDKSKELAAKFVDGLIEAMKKDVELMQKALSDPEFVNHNNPSRVRVTFTASEPVSSSTSTNYGF
jgi:hypothetical protein